MPARSLTLPIVSEASANALLSDLRPTTLSITTLAHLNALLDELLVSIVSSARSINLTHLRTRGASAILTADGQPGEHASLGALGRAAVGEAEVEIRSWYEGHPTARKGVSGFPPNGQGRGLTADAEETGKPFPVLAAVELMRFKVGTLATLAPDLKSAEDRSVVAEWEKAIVGDWKRAGGDVAEETIAPAGLWLTAVLEHVCEHILAKLSQVVARDSAASSASIQDLYTALCEDDSVYSFFKRMQIKNELESLARSAQRPKQRKQRSQRSIGGGTGQSRASSLDSPLGSQPSLVPAVPAKDESHSRQASTSSNSPGAGSGAGVSSGSGSGPSARPASEQFYKSVIGVAKAVPNVAVHKRASSVFTPTPRVTEEPAEYSSGKRASSSATDRAEDEFDAILRSNETVRVSLTPSRFSSFESPRTSPPGQSTRRYSDHLSAPVSSSETSLLSSSTQASTIDSARMARAAAGRSWSSSNKLQPRGATIEERDEEDFGTSVMELLKSEPKVAHADTERSVPAVILLGSQAPHLPVPSGLSSSDTTIAPGRSSPLADTPPLDDRPSPRTDVTTPLLEVPESSAFASSPRSAASDDAHEPKLGTSATYRASRHRSEHLESQREVRELASFLATTGPPVASHHAQEESTTSQSSAQSRMSFKGLMSRMSSTKRHKDDHGNFKAWAEKKHLLSAPAVNNQRPKTGSGPGGSTGALRSQRSASSVATSTSTVQPLMTSTVSLSSPSEATTDTAPKVREVVRKPSLVRKWAAQVTAGEPTRTSSRRRTTPMTISSPLPTVSLDEEPPIEHESKVASPSPQVPTSVLGFVAEPSSPNRESFYTTIEEDFGPEITRGNGTPEAALAALTAGSRSGKSSPVVSRDPEREPSIYDRPVSSSFSARSSPRTGFSQLRHERVHELSEEASVRSTSRANGTAHPLSSSAASTTARSVTESSPSIGTPSVSGSPRAAKSVLPPRTSSASATASANASPRSEHRPLSRPPSSSGYTSTASMDGSIPLSDLLPLRHLLDNATSTRECQLLLDAILSQMGVPRAGEISTPEDRVAAWLLAGRDGPCTHLKEKKVRRKKLSPELAMKNLPALPGSPLVERDEQSGDKLVGLGIEVGKGVRV